MKDVREVIREIAPMLYENDRARSGAHHLSDMSHNNRCNYMTLELYNALTAREYVCRRELHVDGDAWHYLIAHAAPDTEPSQQDIITDLNPWQFEDRPTHTGYLHDPRLAVQIVLAEAGAPPWFVGLRGVASIVEAHTTVPLAKGLLR